MKKILSFYDTKEKIKFGNLEDGQYFYSNGVLYIKILNQDLKEFHINNVNAISVLNAGLTFFNSDEIVINAFCKQKDESC